MTTETTGGADAHLDDDALFDQLASGADLPQDEPEELPQETTQAAPEPAAEAAAAPQEPAVKPVEAQQDAHRVPLRELLDERDRRQALERQIEAMKAQLPKPEAAKAPEFWEKPVESVDHRVAAAIEPLQQALVQQQEAFSRARAEDKFGADAVTDAFNALQSRFAAGDPSARFDHQRIMSAPHPYGALVEWHRQQKAISEFGVDPDAYREKLLSDPAFLAKALERAQDSAKQAQPVVQMPTAAPRRGLPSVSTMGAAAAIGASEDDLDDDALFDRLASAPMRPRRR